MLTKLLIFLGLKKSIEITVKEAISIVEAAPKEQWTTNSLQNAFGQRCFLGHLAKARQIDISQVSILHTQEVAPLDGKIVKFVKEKYKKEIGYCYVVNDTASVNGYTENHPKERILHLLKDMKEAGIK